MHNTVAVLLGKAKQLNMSKDSLSERGFDFSHDYDEVESISRNLLNQTKHRPTLGIICGSGLGGLADIIEDRDVIPYSKIKQFPVSTVPGHAGELVFGVLNGKTVVLMKGRTHLYEGYHVGQTTLPIRVMTHMKIKTLIVTNAAGGLNQTWKVGDVMIIKDHINLASLTGESPLRGINESRWGTRFPAMSDAYDKKLKQLAWDTARELGYESFIHEGVYIAQVGPCFETPAECRFMIAMGADAVGMSTVHESQVARHAGVTVLGMSLITNIAVVGYGDDEAPANHAEVLEAGRIRSSDVKTLVSKIVGKLDL